MTARFLSGLVLLALSVAASAAPRIRQPDRHETVDNRVRPALDPLGVRTGAFRWLPSLELGYEHDDNIFATRGGEVSDDILIVRPRVEVASDWSRHRLAAGVEADIGRYSDNDGEDYADWRIYASGRADLASSQLETRFSHDDLHESRTSPDDVRGLEPTTFSIDSVGLDYRFNPGRVSVEPGLYADRFSFDKTKVSGGGSVDNSDRDRDRLRGRLRVGYQVADSYGLFVEGDATKVAYDRKVDFRGFERSSDGWELLVGSTIDLGGKAFGEFYVGYRHWSYDDRRFENVSGPAFGADLTWNLSGLTTLKFSAARTIESTTIQNAAGIERTAFGLTADHELLRNLILSAMLSAASEDFQGVDRKDDVFAAGGGAKYLLNRHLYAYLGYQYERRDTAPSTSGGREYAINALYLRLQGNL